MFQTLELITHVMPRDPVTSDSPKVFGFRQAKGVPVAAISRFSVLDYFEIA